MCTDLGPITRVIANWSEVEIAAGPNDIYRLTRKALRQHDKIPETLNLTFACLPGHTAKGGTFANQFDAEQHAKKPDGRNRGVSPKIECQ